ncbi:MAG: DEAD/DEAH box helicase, partial [Clostridia bacterium]|nr:DEAD/DEAH box helicase [Clostridia bacterium]
EADEMLNMGFIDDIRTILESAPEEHQTVLFSATLSPEIMKITNDFQNNTVLVKADKGQRTVANIEQSYYNIPKESKNDALKLLIEYHKPKRALVFCNTKKMVDDLTDELCEQGFKAAGLHGDLKQNQRNIVMREFKTGRVRILVATDVAARGIDVDDVEAVFNYDIPQENEYYIHRIGRTGRAGKSGASYTLVANRKQLYRLREIEKYTGASIEEKDIPTINTIVAQGNDEFAASIRKAISRGVDETWKELVSELIEEGYDAEDIAAVLCEKIQKKNKKLAAVQDVKTIKVFKDDRKFGKKKSYRSSGSGSRDYKGKWDQKEHREYKGNRDYKKKPFKAKKKEF